MQTYYLFSIPECAVVLGARGVNYARQLGQEARKIVLKVEVFGVVYILQIRVKMDLALNKYFIHFFINPCPIATTVTW